MTKPDYFWFDGESVRMLIDDLVNATDPILKVRLDDKDSMTLQVLDGHGEPLAQEASRVINESHPCPPQCL